MQVNETEKGDAVKCRDELIRTEPSLCNGNEDDDAAAAAAVAAAGESKEKR